MPEMEIYKFVHELHQQQKNVPVILMTEDVTIDLAREALGFGVCYLFSKPLRHRDIATLWQHVYTATGEMRSSTDATYIDMEKYGCCDSASRNQKQRNLKRKLITSEKEKTKRRKNRIAENSNSSNDSEEEDGCNSEKSGMTPNILGEQRAQPKTILTMLNEPRLTHSQISSHLQRYRDRIRHCVNLQKTVGPAMPTVKPSNFVGYTLDYVKEKLDALNYSSTDNVNAIISNGGFQIPKGSGGVQTAPSIDHNHSTYEIPDANIGEQPQRDVSLIPASSDPILNNGQALQASDDLSNGIQAPNQGPARAGIDVIPATGHSSTGIGMCGLGNGGNVANMNNDNFGEGTSANQESDGNPNNDIDIYKIIQDLEASGINIFEGID